MKKTSRKKQRKKKENVRIETLLIFVVLFMSIFVSVIYHEDTDMITGNVVVGTNTTNISEMERFAPGDDMYTPLENTPFNELLGTFLKYEGADGTTTSKIIGTTYGLRWYGILPRRGVTIKLQNGDETFLPGVKLTDDISLLKFDSKGSVIKTDLKVLTLKSSGDTTPSHPDSSLTRTIKAEAPQQPIQKKLTPIESKPPVTYQVPQGYTLIPDTEQVIGSQVVREYKNDNTGLKVGIVFDSTTGEKVSFGISDTANGLKQYDYKTQKLTITPPGAETGQTFDFSSSDAENIYIHQNLNSETGTAVNSVPLGRSYSLIKSGPSNSFDRIIYGTNTRYAAMAVSNNPVTTKTVFTDTGDDYYSKQIKQMVTDIGAGSIKKFQFAFDLEGTGTIDINTENGRRTIQELNAQHAVWAQRPQNTEQVQLTYTSDFKQGSKSESLKPLQQALTQLGYYSGKIDGDLTAGKAH